MSAPDRAAAFRALHAPGRILVLPNAWDAGSARFIASCGAAAIATTSSGVAWSLGYPDGNVLPPRLLVDAVARIARVLTVPLTVDAEAGYSDDPATVADTVRALIDAGAVGVNLEDGVGPPALLAAKIAAVKRAAASAGVDLFVNARSDVFLRQLAPPEGRVAETLERACAYADAGADGIFVPRADRTVIGKLAGAIALPLNVMVVPDLPPIAELAALGVRRVSAGAAIAQAVFGRVRQLSTGLLAGDPYGALFESAPTYPELNALF